MIPDPLFYFLAVVAVVLFALGKAGLVGSALPATGLLALAIPPLQAVAILVPVMLLGDAISVWAYRKDWDRWTVAVMLPGVVLGTALAWIVAAAAVESHVRIVVGSVLLAIVLYEWARPRVSYRRPRAALGVTAGVASGFAGLLANASSAPFLAFTLPQKLDKLTFAGTAAMFFAVTDVFKLPPLIALGQLTTTNVLTSLLLFPLALVANLFGIWLVRKVRTDVFYHAAYSVAFAAGLFLLWQGVRGTR